MKNCAVGSGLLAFAKPAFGAVFVPVVGAARDASAPSTGFTTFPMDTTGCDFIMMFSSSESCTLSFTSDLFGNTWTRISPAGDTFGSFWYCQPTTVGANHTATWGSNNVSNSYAITVGFSGSKPSTTFETETDTATGAGATSITSPSITPLQTNEMVIIGVAGYNSTSLPTTSGISSLVSGQAYSGASKNVSLWYAIQTSPAAIGPTFSFSNGSFLNTVAGAFKSTSSSAGTTIRRRVSVIGGE